MILAYLLPTGGNRYAFWCPEDARAGELPDSRFVVLSPFVPEARGSELAALAHDNLYRWQARRGLPRRYASSFWFRMIWGLLALLALNNPTEDILWGLYLLLAQPILCNVVEGIWKRHARLVRARFDTVVRMPDVEIVASPALVELAGIIEREGAAVAVRHLHWLGLVDLTGFYRRAAWAGRWRVGPPTGMGVFERDGDHLRAVGG